MRGNEGFLALAVLAVALLYLGSRAWDGDGRFNPAREPAPTRFEDGGDRLVLSAGPNGHFFFEAEANGAPIRFMVDSGASLVTLTEADARRAGLEPRRGETRLPFDTANGTVMARVGEIDELRLGSAVMRDLRVAIVPDDRLGGSLFGVNGLNRFSRREASADELVLYVDQ